MGVFEDVVINARTAAATVGRQAGKLVDISMLRLDAADLQREISKKYEALGRMVYDSYKSGGSVSGSFDEHIESIDGLYKKLDEVNEKISVLRNKTVCPSCGFHNDEKSTFCSRCGTKLATESAQSGTPTQSGEEQTAQGTCEGNEAQ